MQYKFLLLIVLCGCTLKMGTNPQRTVYTCEKPKGNYNITYILKSGDCVKRINKIVDIEKPPAENCVGDLSVSQNLCDYTFDITCKTKEVETREIGKITFEENSVIGEGVVSLHAKGNPMISTIGNECNGIYNVSYVKQ